MNTNIDLFTFPVRSYDVSKVDYNSIYDHMPYIWDTDLNMERRIIRESGNIIKSYRCLMNETYEIKHE